ncbi:MAG: 3-hydroxyacyl-CoA dehydrogenase family protein [Chloroflexi bacterium]|nr:3-hydroxyacyl-CoA dehydrogenase family protein [Chloroflexota bacterium]
MEFDDVKTIAVIGAGNIGHGIALTLGLAGYQVNLNSTNETSLQKGMDFIKADLDRLVELDMTKPDLAQAALTKISTTTSLEEASSDSDVVIEAVYENLELKQQVFRDLDSFCPERTILASSTSTMIPSRFAEVTQRPDRVLVAHYTGPAFVSPLVEIVRTEQTSDETVDIVFKVLTKSGKRPVIVQKEVPGFIANRLNAALFREALSIVQRGIASPEDIDIVLKTGHPRRWVAAGLFEALDVGAGGDLLLAGMALLLPEIDSSMDVMKLLQEKVDKGELGAKTGKGFYDWTPEAAEAARRKIANVFIEIEKWSEDGV